MPAIAQAKTKIRVGYPHTIAVDGQIRTGMDRGTFEKQGLDLELRQFNTGLEANDFIVANSNEAMEALQKAHYSQAPLADINESFKAQKMFTSRDWKRLYSDGTVTNGLQQSTDFFLANAGIKDFTPASKYFDPSLYSRRLRKVAICGKGNCLCGPGFEG